MTKPNVIQIWLSMRYVAPEQQFFVNIFFWWMKISVLGPFWNFGWSCLKGSAEWNPLFCTKNIAFWLHCSDSSAWTVGWLLSERRCRTEPLFLYKKRSSIRSIVVSKPSVPPKKSLQKAGTTWLRWVMDFLFGFGKFDHKKLHNPMLRLWILLTVFIC